MSWLNTYLRQDSEKERANHEQTVMEAGVHDMPTNNNYQYYTGMGPCPASPRLQEQSAVPTTGFDPRAQEGIHDMPTRLGFPARQDSFLRQESILSVDSSLQSPTSIVERGYKNPSVYLDSDVQDDKTAPITSASMESLSSQHRTISKCCMAFLVTFGIVLLAAAFAVLFVTWHQNRRNFADSPTFGCVPCNHLVLSSDPLDDHRAEFEHRWEGTERVCCARNATQFERLIILVSPNLFSIHFDF